MSSPNLKNVSALHQKVRNYFGGKTPDSHNSSGEGFNFSGLKNIIKHSRNKLIIIYILSFFVSLYILRKTKPGIVLQKRKTFDKPNKVCTWRLLISSVIMAIILTCVICFAAYKFPKARRLLFNDVD